jgi:sulfur carrier protein ThiS
MGRPRAAMVECARKTMDMVKIILRNQEFEVRAGMTLRDALRKCNILSETVIATRQGEMITEDEILKEGETIKLVAVISGG